MADTGTHLWVGLPRCSGRGQGVRAAGARAQGKEVGQEVGEARPRSQGRGHSELLLRKVPVSHAVKSRLGTQWR